MTKEDLQRYLETDIERANAMMAHADELPPYLLSSTNGRKAAIKDVQSQLDSSMDDLPQHLEKALKSMKGAITGTDKNPAVISYLLYFIEIDSMITGQSYADLLDKYA